MELGFEPICAMVGMDEEARPELIDLVQEGMLPREDAAVRCGPRSESQLAEPKRFIAIVIGTPPA